MSELFQHDEIGLLVADVWQNAGQAGLNYYDAFTVTYGLSPEDAATYAVKAANAEPNSEAIARAIREALDKVVVTI